MAPGSISGGSVRNAKQPLIAVSGFLLIICNRMKLYQTHWIGQKNPQYFPLNFDLKVFKENWEKLL